MYTPNLVYSSLFPSFYIFDLNLFDLIIFYFILFYIFGLILLYFFSFSFWGMRVILPFRGDLLLGERVIARGSIFGEILGRI